MTAHQNQTEFISVSSVVAEQRGWDRVVIAVIDVSGAHDESPVPCVRDRCKQGFHRHMTNNTGFINFPIETAAAFPSRTVAAFPLTSTVQPSLDPLTVNDPWASAVAVVSEGGTVRLTSAWRGRSFG